VRHSEYIDFLNLAIFNMPVNSLDARRFGTEPHYGGDLSLYTGFAHPGGWDRARVRHFLDREFKRHPAIAPIIAGDPPFFTSNSRAFFCGRFQGLGAGLSQSVHLKRIRQPRPWDRLEGLLPKCKSCGRCGINRAEVSPPLAGGYGQRNMYRMPGKQGRGLPSLAEGLGEGVGST